MLLSDCSNQTNTDKLEIDNAFNDKFMIRFGLPIALFFPR